MLLQTIKFEDKLLEIYGPCDYHSALRLPVIYLLDGNAFGNVVDQAISLQSRNSLKTGVSSAIIVAVGYQESAPFNREARFNDYTPKRLWPILADKRRDFPNGGGIEEFQVQLCRIHELINENYLVAEKVGLMGHSLGGLCTLESYLASDKLTFITDFLAISPSLWWDQANFFNKLEELNDYAAKRIFIAVENDKDEMENSAKKAYNILNKQLAEDNIAFYVGEEENHMSIVFNSLSRILRWFFLEECKK